MNPESQLDALRYLYDAGAFLRCARQDKSPIGRLVGRFRIRSPWRAIEPHLRAGGHVLYYQPAIQGLLVLDFDPMLSDRLEAVEAILGSPAYRSFPSSGKWKPAEGNRPAGYGGHAVWRIDPAMAAEIESIRRFSDRPDGDHFGEVFGGHPMFGFITWNARALVDTMELDDAECIDPRRLRISRYSFAKRNADGTWSGGEGSRHDLAVSETCRAAHDCVSDTDFEERLSEIKTAFRDSFSDPIEYEKRMRGGEWSRIETHARTLRSNNRAQHEKNHRDLIAAIRNR